MLIDKSYNTAVELRSIIDEYRHILLVDGAQITDIYTLARML
jgi:hypothetical protein